MYILVSSFRHTCFKWLSRYTFIVALVLLSTMQVQAQLVKWTQDKVGSFLADTVSAEQPRFLNYPTLAYSPETSWEIGLSSLYLYHANRDTANRLSEINAFTFFTLESQYGIWLDHALYSDQDQWFFLGRLRGQSFPLYYHGIGEESPDEALAVVDARYLILRERALRRIFGDFYLGLEVDWQRLSNVTFNWEGPPAALPLGADGSSNLGLGVGLLHDDRHNVLNVRKGWFAELAYLNYGLLNQHALSFSSFILDSRWYVPTAKQQLLAVQLYGQSVSGDVPFNQLALMGGESLMRGYYLGRYRDRNLLATQVEYRWLPFPFSRRWGGAVFMGMGGVAPTIGDLNLASLKPAGGAGVRFLLFKNKDIFTRLDVAFTEEGSGVYFFIGEAF